MFERRRRDSLYLKWMVAERAYNKHIKTHSCDPTERANCAECDEHSARCDTAKEAYIEECEKQRHR